MHPRQPTRTSPLAAPRTGRLGASVLIRLLVPTGLLCLFVLLPMTAWGWSEARMQPAPELAYIDPGAGSFVIQALVAMVAGIAVTGRLYWSKIKRMLGLASPDDEDKDSIANDD